MITEKIPYFTFCPFGYRINTFFPLECNQLHLDLPAEKLKNPCNTLYEFIIVFVAFKQQYLNFYTLYRHFLHHVVKDEDFYKLGKSPNGIFLRK